jgi:hypothetical protein
MATSQAEATNQAIRATEMSLSFQATSQALSAQSTREAIAATATVGAHQAQATRQALDVELSQLEIERSRGRNDFLETTWTLALGALLAVAVGLTWGTVRRAKMAGAVSIRVGQADVIDDVIDADVIDNPPGWNGSNRRPGPVALLPPEVGWVPVYLRPIKTDERQYQRAG